MIQILIVALKNSEALLIMLSLTIFLKRSRGSSLAFGMVPILGFWETMRFAGVFGLVPIRVSGGPRIQVRVSSLTPRLFSGVYVSCHGTFLAFVLSWKLLGCCESEVLINGQERSSVPIGVLPTSLHKIGREGVRAAFYGLPSHH